MLRRLVLLPALLFTAQVSAQGPLAPPEADIATVSEADQIRLVIDSGTWHPALPTLYASRGDAKAWTVTGDIRRLTERFDAARADGLAPETLHLSEIRALGASGESARRDVILTDAALRLADALAGRRVDPEALHEGHWFLTREAKRRRETDTAAMLREALESEAPALTFLQAVESLQPTHPEYHALRQRLDQLLDADADSFLPASTRRADESATYPEPIDVSDPGEITRLRLNLERWRWLPDDFGDAHVLVNVPAGRLRLRDGVEASGEPRVILDMEATVGQSEPHWQTPVLSDPIRSVSFFPTWTPTVTIQRREIIPQAREDGGQSLYERGFDVYRGRQRLDPRDVDWDRARAGQYRIVQRGGPKGELGRVKFVMPNPHWILIHDTNTPEEFESDPFALSHGCVRAEDPGALADAILTRTNGWNDSRASSMIAGAPRTTGVSLRTRFPVHLVYFTAWPLADGTIAWYDDLYGRDRELASALGLTLAPEASGVKAPR